jgi:hypothetical protein
MSLDIQFSDHHLSRATLDAFGAVVRALRQVCDDDKQRFWAFIYYISVHHPNVLGVKMPVEQQRSCALLLERANPPPVVVEESDRGRFMRELEEKHGKPADE